MIWYDREHFEKAMQLIRSDHAVSTDMTQSEKKSISCKYWDTIDCFAQLVLVGERDWEGESIQKWISVWSEEKSEFIPAGLQHKSSERHGGVFSKYNLLAPPPWKTWLGRSEEKKTRNLPFYLTHQVILLASLKMVA